MLVENFRRKNTVSNHDTGHTTFIYIFLYYGMN